MRQGTEEFAKEIGSRIEAARLKAGISQKELARLADLDPRTIRSVEAGKQLPKFLTIYLIARALKIQPGEIV
jgi:transcriptional regulator with XRE-family HTH domain